MGLSSLPGRWTGPGLLLGLCATTVTPLASYYSDYTNPGYDEAAAYIRGHAESAPIFAGNGTRVVSYYYLNEYPRLGTAEWRSFIERVPFKTITFGTSTGTESFSERLAPGVYWAGGEPLDTLASLTTTSHIWRADLVSACSDFEANSEKAELLDKKVFTRGVRACLFEIVSPQ